MDLLPNLLPTGIGNYKNFLTLDPIQKIENNQISTDNKENILSINIDIDGLSFIVFNEKTIFIAEKYQWQAKDWSFAATKIIDIFAKNFIFSKTYKKTLCFFQNRDTCLIPNAFYLPSENKNALETYLGKKDLAVFSSKLSKFQIHLLFAVDNEISKFLKSKLPQVEFLHNSAFNIDNAYRNSLENQIIKLDIYKQYFEVIGLSNRKLIAHNYFEFQTVDEFMFLLLSFVKNNNFDTEELILKVSGELMMNSKIGIKLNKYFKNIKFEVITNSKEALFETLKKYTLLANN